MVLEFIGADREVTGSCHYLTFGDTHILIDCGMEQGADLYVNQEIPVNPSLIDYVFVTHAHIDHSGLLPLIYNHGFRGTIFATKATTDLCNIMLKDSAHIQEIEKQTGTQIRMEFPKDPVYAFANDEELTETAKVVGAEVFGDKFVLEGEDELFLSGDNAYRYFRETRGLFTVFLAGIPGENHPLHHPKFQLDERILPYSVETLYKIITTL